MLRLCALTRVFIPASGLALLAPGCHGRLGATWYPGYYTTELVGVANGNSAAPAAEGQSLLSNGTVIGQSSYQYAVPLNVPTWYICSWNASGAMTSAFNGGSNVWNAFGDGSGQIAASLSITFDVWNGTSFAPTGNPNLATGIDFNGMSRKWIVRGGPR